MDSWNKTQLNAPSLVRNRLEGHYLPQVSFRPLRDHPLVKAQDKEG